MSGAYFVGGSTPNFSNIQEACDSLMAQGISGNVTIKIADGVYDYFSLQNVSGTSATSKITFESASLDSSKVNIVSDTASTTINCNHIELKHLTFSNNGSTTLKTIESESIEDLTLDYCQVNSGYHGLTIQSGNSLSNSKKISITHCNFECTGIGILLSTDVIEDISIQNSDFKTNMSSIYIYGIYSFNDLLVDSCNLHVTGGGNNRGVRVYSAININDVKIYNSNIQSGGEGIHLVSEYIIDHVSIENITGKTTPNYNFIYMDGYSDKVKNVSIKKIYSDSLSYGIEIKTKWEMSNIEIDSIDLITQYGGIELNCSDGYVNNLSLKNASVKSINGYAVNLYANTTSNIFIAKDSLFSTTRSALYLGGRNIGDIEINDVFAQGDTNLNYYYGLVVSGDKPHEILLKNSTFIGGSGALFSTNVSQENITLSNSTFIGKSNTISQGTAGIKIDSDGPLKNLIIDSSYFISNKGVALYLYSQGNSDSLTIQNSRFYSINHTMLYEPYGQVNNFTIQKNKFTTFGSNSSGIYLSPNYGSLKNLVISENKIKARSTGIGMDVYYGNGVINATIDSNNIFMDTLSSSFRTGFYIYSDTKIDGVNVRGNYIKSTGATQGDLLSLQGYNLGISNTKIDGNTIKTDNSNGTGIYLEGVKDSVYVTNNHIDSAINKGLGLGVYLSGDNFPSSEIHIKDNQVYNSRAALYMERTGNVVVEGNKFENRVNNITGNSYGLYLYEMKNGPVSINRNTFYNAHPRNNGSDVGLNIQSTSLNQNDLIITNNMFGNYARALYLEETKNAVILNNSFTTSKDYDAVLIDYGADSNIIQNNIFQVDTSIFTSDLISLYGSYLFNQLDFNVFNLDTSKFNYLNDDWYSVIYKDIESWTNYSLMDSNSFTADVDFINDTLDLHLSCSNTFLASGKNSSLVTNDIDGFTRSTTPYIGADELISVSPIIFSQDTIDATGLTSYTLDANLFNANYSWNTGDTNKTITINTSGTYVVSITDNCGTYSDTVYVTFSGFASVHGLTINKEIKLYPNPNNGEFTLEVDNSLTKKTIVIFDVTGRVVYRKQSQTSLINIDLKDQEKGTYILRIYDKDKTNGIKFIID